ncbi:hypothetical protein A1Q1_05336 [Trichosporon asahii var. asahii CBS 2479]|uniref:Maf-like protein n=1 Tax=Trichosporon asahii var. asahii (strain ATCC 90039 / CBS 2479 / JCM 2466 / KCTC 7840 / NBRC 103889/ NCYC 2677 / UAMH 7654) TaxID=1186058 RepID=J4U788_TRIAS|nr:hypothetical protein A1Q1_05336 [Trichosporon asahii var. asahii CBS 2479]EJT46125.1 hypothetical protein A1Q1_05336 [Trichosporon asahii var. asahii CBS 2479]
MSAKRPSPVLPNAMPWPIFEKLRDKRVVLASGSPRRKDILENVGFRPEIIPSTFAEDLPKGSFDKLSDYPIATAGEKVRAANDFSELTSGDGGLRAPDQGKRRGSRRHSDTVVIFPPEKDTAEGGKYHGEHSEILEKPINKEEQLRALDLMAGRECEVVTAVCSISVSTIVHFFDYPKNVIQAYIDNGEGIDRAGGFAIQGLGGLLIEKIDGSYDNCVG